MLMNGAQAVLESLRKENVEVVFGYPGGAVLTLYDELYKMKFPHILTKHGFYGDGINAEVTQEG